MFAKKYRQQTGPKPQIDHWRVVWDFIAAHKLLFTIGIGSVIFCTILQVTLPQLIGHIIHYLQFQTLPQNLESLIGQSPLLGLASLYIMASLLLILGRMGWRTTLVRSTHYGACQLKESIFSHALRMPRELLDHRYDLGTLMNISSSDVASARFLFGFTLIAVIDVIFLGFFTLVSMAWIDLPITLSCVSLFFVVPFIIKTLTKREAQAYEVAQQRLSNFNELCAQAVKTVRLQRLNQTSCLWAKKLENAATSYRDKNLLAHRASLAFYPTMGASSVVSMAILFFFGLYRCLQGHISAGQFVALQGLVLLLQEPLTNLGAIISEWQRSITSLKRIIGLLNKPLANIYLKEDRLNNNSRDQSIPTLRVNNLSFSHQDSNEPLFKDLNFKLYHRQRLGITGPIGSGKSTLLHLLMGEYTPDQGKIELFGSDLCQWNHYQLTQWMIHLPQSPYVFAQSIAQNIAMGQKMGEERIWHYLEITQMADDIGRLPRHIHTPLGEWGVNLSGGQKQRLSLARALARNPKVLLLDDCLSAVDTVTEEKILRRLDTELKQTTIAWVAHRKSTLKYCDSLLEMSL